MTQSESADVSKTVRKKGERSAHGLSSHRPSFLFLSSISLRSKEKNIEISVRSKNRRNARPYQRLMVLRHA